MTAIHVDTDIGGDTDDLCALAMLLGWSGVDMVGVTTCSEERGMRAALASHALRVARWEDISVVAGTEGSLGGYRSPHGLSDVDRYWQVPVEPKPSPLGAALDLLAKNAEEGATVVAIGSWTNLALLEVARPGLLSSTRVVVMGGHVRLPGAGLVPWTPDMDYNVQQDTVAARLVWERCAPVLVQLPVCLEAGLREAHLAKLRQGGRLARLIARQGELHGADWDMRRTVREHPGLPDDLLNFHYDPLACAVATGWDGALVEELELVARLEDGLLVFDEAPGGRKTSVVTDIEGSRFEEEWLRVVASVAPES